VAALPVPAGKVMSVAYAPDGKAVAAGLGGTPTSGEVRVWDVSKVVAPKR
jgi:hypothetical protein